MNLICPHCKKKIGVSDQHAGQMMKCPLCAGVFVAPKASAAPNLSSSSSSIILPALPVEPDTVPAPGRAVGVNASLQPTPPLSAVGSNVAAVEIVPLFKFISRAVLLALKDSKGGDTFVTLLPESAPDIWDWWCANSNEEQRRAEFEELASMSVAAAKQQIGEILAKLAPSEPESTHKNALTYLAQIPPMVRRALRRPSDPSGTTVPTRLVPQSAQDIMPLLPGKMPRFHAGDRPLPGVDWELDELLGVGGFGEVWKAHNPHFDSVPPVALKFCLDQTSKTQLLRHEAEVLNQVMKQGKHPGIVQLQHTYLSSDWPCLEYEYVEGGDLTGLMLDWQRTQGKLAPMQAAEVLLQLADIVGYAHQMDPPIVHRDLKPANILVQRSQDGHTSYKIADFGIGGLAATQAIRQAPHGTTRGQFMSNAMRGAHTPLYASPQQIRGEEPDPRDDVYALGVIWYQLLTGDLATGRPGGTRWQQRLLGLGMSSELVDLLGSCFEDNKEDRPPTAASLVELLAANLEAELSATVTVEELARLRAGGSIAPTESQQHFETEPEVEEDPRQAEDFYNEGMECLEARDHFGAVVAFTESIHRDPHYALAYMQRAQALLNVGEFDKAIEDCGATLELEPTVAAVYLLRSQAHRRKNDHLKAIADCNEALRLSPDELTAFYNRGTSYFERGDYDRAIADFTEVMRLNPNVAIAYYYRGQSRLKKGEQNEAIADFTESIRLNPKIPSAFFFRGEALLGMNNYDGAIADFTQVIQLDPSVAQAFFSRSQAHRKKGDFRRYKLDYNEAIRLDPSLATQKT